MTYDEKIELAAKLRESNFIEPEFSDEYLAFQELVEIEDTSVATSEGMTHLYIHRAKKKNESCPIFINIHGGGFVRPHKPCNRYFCAKTAALIKGIVIDIDYRLAPEYPYPTAFNECSDVTEWAFQNAERLGGDADKIVIGGHSAGASLTLAVVMKRNFARKQLPKLQVLDFGAFDLVSDPAEKHGASSNVISAERARAFNLLYTDNDPKILFSPYCSPVYCPDEEFTGLPSTLIITADHDSLKDEAEDIGRRIAEQGTPVTMQRFKNSNHGFTVHCTGEWEASQKLIIDSIKQAT